MSFSAPPSSASNGVESEFGDHLDLNLVAEGLGSSEEYAAFYLEGQEDFLNAVAEAQEAAPETFASSAWTPDNLEPDGYKAWVSFTSGVSPDVLAIFRGLEVPVDIRVDASYSMVELEDLQVSVMESLLGEGKFKNLASNIDESGDIEIQYEVSSLRRSAGVSPDDVQALAEESLAEELAVEGDAPKISVVPATGIGSEPEVVRGGEHLPGNTCTLGFTATSGTTRGGITAAHCGNSAGTPPGSNVAMRYLRGHFGGSGDFQMHSTTDSIQGVFRIRSYSTPSNPTVFRPVNSVGAVSSGASVCNFGRTRPTSSCTTVRNANHAFTYDGTVLGGMVQTNGSFTNGGDSGGPWYSNNAALGIHFGKSGGYSTFSRATNAQQTLNVTIRRN